MTSLKTCFTCGVEKATTEFYNNRRKRDGLEPSCKPCTLAKQRAYYEKNKAKVIARTRAYHQAHPEWSKERLRASHEKHREVRAARAIERGKDPEVREKRRDASRRSESRRRAIVRGVIADAISQATYETILEEHDYSCWICGVDLRVEPIHWDHYQPLSRGGHHIVGNLRPACAPCNVRKNARWPFTDDMKTKISDEVSRLRQKKGGDANVNLLR